MKNTKPNITCECGELVFKTTQIDDFILPAYSDKAFYVCEHCKKGYTETGEYFCMEDVLKTLFRIFN